MLLKLMTICHYDREKQIWNKKEPCMILRNPIGTYKNIVILYSVDKNTTLNLKSFVI